MSNLTGRVKQLEKDAGTHDRYKFMCVDYSGWGERWNKSDGITPEGYKVQPFVKNEGGTGGEPFYLATREELDTFAARPDVELFLIRVGYAGEEPTDEPTQTGE